MSATPKSVTAKLGFKPGMVGWVRRRPDALAEALPFLDGPVPADANVLIGFVRNAAEVAPMLAELLPAYARGRALWFAYPKKTGPLASDISRDHGWAPLATAGLLPVTQVALDADWSALRFRYRDEIARLTRKSDRPAS